MGEHDYLTTQKMFRLRRYVTTLMQRHITQSDLSFLLMTASPGHWSNRIALATLETNWDAHPNTTKLLFTTPDPGGGGEGLQFLYLVNIIFRTVVQFGSGGSNSYPILRSHGPSTMCTSAKDVLSHVVDTAIVTRAHAGVTPVFMGPVAVMCKTVLALQFWKASMPVSGMT